MNKIIVNCLKLFKKTHDEANRLVLSKNRLKELNSWLEKRVKSVEDEIKKSKNDLKNLENHFKNSFCKCDTLICENCEKLEKKVHYLVDTVTSFQKGNLTLRMSWHLKAVFLERLV